MTVKLRSQCLYDSIPKPFMTPLEYSLRVQILSQLNLISP